MISMINLISNAPSAEIRSGITIGDADALSTTVTIMIWMATISVNIAKGKCGTTTGDATRQLINAMSMTIRTMSARGARVAIGITTGDAGRLLKTVMSIPG